MVRCRKRVEDNFDREKQAGQLRAVVQQEEMGRVAEEASPVDQLAHIE